MTHLKNLLWTIEGEGTAELVYDVAATGETATFMDGVLTTGDLATAAFELFPDSSSATKKISFDGLITSFEHASSLGDIQTINITFKPNGTITSVINKKNFSHFMTNQRTADLIINGFKDEMTTRRKYELKDSAGKILATLYFPPITRFDRQKAQQLAGTDEALTVSTQLLCKRKRRWNSSF